MSRRRLLVLAAGAVAVVSLLCLRPFGGGADQAGEPAGSPPPAPATGDPPAFAPPAAPASSSPSASPSSSAAPHDHVHDEEGLVTGVEALAAAEVSEAVRAAERFTVAISDPEPDWHARAAELSTPELAASLTEPVAQEVTSGGFVLLDAPEWARIGVPADRGTIVVDVTMVDGQWLASALAWWPEGVS